MNAAARAMSEMRIRRRGPQVSALRDQNDLQSHREHRHADIQADPRQVLRQLVIAQPAAQYRRRYRQGPQGNTARCRRGIAGHSRHTDPPGEVLAEGNSTDWMPSPTVRRNIRCPRSEKAACTYQTEPGRTSRAKTRGIKNVAANATVRPDINSKAGLKTDSVPIAGDAAITSAAGHQFSPRIRAADDTMPTRMYGNQVSTYPPDNPQTTNPQTAISSPAPDWPGSAATRPGPVCAHNRCRNPQTTRMGRNRILRFRPMAE